MIKIGGLQKLTLIDYPKKTACTVFLSGCNFRCPWCYSPELVLPEKIKKQPEISQEDFFSFLQKRKNKLDGVVICGGEPTIHSELPQFIEKIKELGFLVKLDTNGSNLKMIERLINEDLIDYIAMDIKAPLDIKSQTSNPKSQINSKFQIPKYQKMVGMKVDLEKIRESVELIKNSGIDYEFRTTVVPGFHKKEDIIQIAKDISPAGKYFLQQFRAEKTIDDRLLKTIPFSKKELANWQKEISVFVKLCEIR